MSREQILLLILAVNTLGSLVYLVVMSLRKKNLEPLFIAITMIACPLVGPLYLMLSRLIVRLTPRRLSIDKSHFSFLQEDRGFVERPDYETEINMANLEETFLVASKKEKRAALLTKLKRGFASNVSSISLAIENEDSETSHYAASAIMKAKDEYIQTIRELAQAYMAGQDVYMNCRAYSDALLSYVGSGILSALEKSEYQYEYVAVVTTLFERHRSDLHDTDVKTAVDFLVENRDYYRAEEFLDRVSPYFSDSEAIHLSYLKVYFSMSRHETFREYLEKMKKSDVVLSKKGVDLIRFFRGI